MKVIGYGICGSGEAKKYLKATLEEFKRLCDETIILCNNTGKEEESLIHSYGFKMAHDDREWGMNQQRLKHDFLVNHVAKLKPDWCVCLDMDEVFETRFNRKELEKLTETGWGFHFFIVNLWEKGHKPRLNFWNVRMWKWNGNCDFLDRRLHPGLAPMWAYFINQYAPFIVRHYGLKEAVHRQAKIERYAKYDPNAQMMRKSYYDDLKTLDYEIYNEDTLHREVEEYVKKYKPTIVKKPMAIPKRQFVIIKRTNLKTGEEFNFDVAVNEAPRYLSQRTPTLNFEVMGDVEDTTEEITKMFEKTPTPAFEEKNPNSKFRKFTPKRVKRPN